MCVTPLILIDIHPSLLLVKPIPLGTLPSLRVLSLRFSTLECLPIFRTLQQLKGPCIEEVIISFRAHDVPTFQPETIPWSDLAGMINSRPSFSGLRVFRLEYHVGTAEERVQKCVTGLSLVRRSEILTIKIDVRPELLFCLFLCSRRLAQDRQSKVDWRRQPPLI